MILEWLQSLTTPASGYVRSLGLVHEAIAIEARYKRCRNAWAPHLQKSKDQILTAATGLDQYGDVLVMGSGGLHDVPLADLSRTFSTVTLWDIVHTRRARRLGANFPNVASEVVDVTGLCRDFHGWLSGPGGGPPQPRLPTDLPTGSPDLVVSLNLLSQLPLQMVAKATAKGRGDQLGNFADKVILSHIDWLRSLPCRVLLITDLERHYAKGGRVEVEEALPVLDTGRPLADWLWEVAPPGESAVYDTIHHKVGAFVLNE